MTQSMATWKCARNRLYSIRKTLRCQWSKLRTKTVIIFQFGRERWAQKKRMSCRWLVRNTLRCCQRMWLRRTHFAQSNVNFYSISIMRGPTSTSINWVNCNGRRTYILLNRMTWWVVRLSAAIEMLSNQPLIELCRSPLSSIRDTNASNSIHCGWTIYTKRFLSIAP